MIFMNYGILFCIIVNMCILKFYMWEGNMVLFLIVMAHGISRVITVENCIKFFETK